MLNQYVRLAVLKVSKNVGSALHGGRKVFGKNKIVPGSG